MNASFCWKRGFWSLMATQFQNAFSDNALKNLVILLVLSKPMSQEQRDTSVMLAGALFALPFILLSMLGGWLADRFPKNQVISCIKAAEIFIMLFAAGALFLGNLPMELFAIFLMGSHSALFGPSKYGSLPELLPFERLSWGNGILELLTFLGIISGTLAGGLFAGWFKEAPAVS
jgi:acyl-[acyl-carrier-protein]-phospholipid O-acyltransferase/long-chain-fatty-acid--[acyl-carrier-protein] ligase